MSDTMFTNWKRNADRETRLNPLSIDDIDALTIATLHGMGTTPEKFRENTKQDMDVDITDQGEAIMRRNPKLQMPDSHFKLRDAQEQQEIDDIELKIPEFEFDEERAKTAGGLREMERAQGINRALNAYKSTYKDHIMQAFDKHKAFMQSLGNQPMTVQEFMQHPKVPSFTDYYNQAREGTIPGGDLLTIGTVQAIHYHHPEWKDCLVTTMPHLSPSSQASQWTWQWMFYLNKITIWTCYWHYKMKHINWLK
jgi:hypothetical protein